MASEPNSASNGASNKTENVKLGCCNFCNAASTRRCSGCSLVAYCGREHQVQDWKEHKKMCSMVKRVGTGSAFEVQAKVDIAMLNGLYPKQVMKLNPMLLIPVLPDEQQLKAFATTCPMPMDANIRPVLVPCLGCYQLMGFGHIIIDPDRGVCYGECSKCGWPVHNQSCAESKHHQDECEFFHERGIHPQKKYQNLPNDFLCIGILRALLFKLKKKPEWDSLMNMPVEFPRKDPNYIIADYVRDQDLREIYVKKFIYEKCRFTKSFISETELERVIRAVRSNLLPSQQMMDYNKGYASMIFHGPDGRVLTHSCRPNCYVKQVGESLESSVWTHREIKAGEALTINYLGGHGEELMGLSMLSRAIHLQNRMGSPPCTCPMCADPTECGTYFSAIRCTARKCTGFVLPDEPTNWSNLAPWTCTISECGQKMKMEEVEARVILIRRKFHAQGWDNLSASMKIINDFETKVLHPNHYRILSGLTDITVILFRRMSVAGQYFNSSSIIPSHFVHHRHEDPKYMDVFERMMKFYDMVQPGATPIYLNVLFYASLLRISAMAEEFRAVRFESGREKEELLTTKGTEFGQIAKDLNRSIQEFRTNIYIQYHPQEIMVKPMFLLKAYCCCLAMAIKPILSSTYELETSTFREIINEDWEFALRNGEYAQAFMFAI